MSLSLCTTCMNRTHHLKLTLPYNLREISQFWPHASITLINYNSTDDMHDWVMRTFQAEMRYGLLHYFRTVEPRYFRMSHAKNVAHLLSQGDILFNVDADNFVDRSLIACIFKSFRINPDILMRGEQFFGVGGRIAILRKNFLRLRGYNESFIGWGEEDEEFYERCLIMGLELVRMEEFDHSIEHSNKERLENLPPDSFVDLSKIDPRKYAKIHGLAMNNDLNGTWLKNYLIRSQKLHQAGYRVNLGRPWGWLDMAKLSTPGSRVLTFPQN